MSVRGSDEAGIGASVAVQQPLTSAFAFTVCPANATVTSVPGRALPVTGTGLPRCSTMCEVKTSRTDSSGSAAGSGLRAGFSASGCIGAVLRAVPSAHFASSFPSRSSLHDGLSAGIAVTPSPSVAATASCAARSSARTRPHGTAHGFFCERSFWRTSANGRFAFQRIRHERTSARSLAR